jgi:hypothetical protein
VCYDCHGVHEIRRVDDPEKGLQVRENLLARCQVCHPDATLEFSDSWTSHYIPSPQNNPLVYYVNLFYKFLIPGVLGGMAVLVALDASWQIRRRLGDRLPFGKDDQDPPERSQAADEAKPGDEKIVTSPAADSEQPSSTAPAQHPSPDAPALPVDEHQADHLEDTDGAIKPVDHEPEQEEDIEEDE